MDRDYRRVAGIQEWARRIRELRVEHGYEITELGGSRYRLDRGDPNEERAKQWKLANGIRKRLLNDGARDTGCGLKAFRRDSFLALPYFDHMHRYLIALMLREGYRIDFVAVAHRPRRVGQSKYGVWDRLTVGISDLAGVMWLNRRFRGADTPREL